MLPTFSWLAALVALGVPGRAQAHDSRESDAKPECARHSTPCQHPAPRVGGVRLFDVKSARMESNLAASYLDVRRSDAQRHGRGMEFRMGPELTWDHPWTYITSSTVSALRVIDSRSVSLSLLQNGGHAGVRFGPLCLGAGFAVSLFSVDYLKHDLSAGMLSPRARAFLGLRLGAVRIGLEGHSEYYWRWFGKDYTFRGIGLSLELFNPSFAHPLFQEKH